jgi:hypothetical protein
MPVVWNFGDNLGAATATTRLSISFSSRPTPAEPVTASGATGGRPVSAVVADVVEYLHSGTAGSASRNALASVVRNG